MLRGPGDLVSRLQVELHVFRASGLEFRGLGFRDKSGSKYPKMELPLNFTTTVQAIIPMLLAIQIRKNTNANANTNTEYEYECRRSCYSMLILKY